MHIAFGKESAVTTGAEQGHGRDQPSRFGACGCVRAMTECTFFEVVRLVFHAENPEDQKEPHTDEQSKHRSLPHSLI
jgi:hypothetical protein